MPVPAIIQSGQFTGLPRNHFACVLADPPWLYKSNSKANPGRNAMRHYDCMPLPEIAALPVKELILPNTLLAMWIPGPFLAIGAHIPIMRAWGFRPTSMGFVWLKTKKNHNEDQLHFLSSVEADFYVGQGQTTRKNAEFVVFGRRGAPPRLARDVRELIISPRRQHSRKPPRTQKLLERYTAGPYLELFARESREGWTTWGNQNTKFDQQKAA